MLSCVIAHWGCTNTARVYALKVDWGKHLMLHWEVSFIIIIIIMYVYRSLINALSAHIIHINLNMIFCTHVEHSSIKNNVHKLLYGNTHTYYDCSRNWVLILVGAKIL